MFLFKLLPVLMKIPFLSEVIGIPMIPLSFSSDAVRSKEESATDITSLFKILNQLGWRDLVILERILVITEHIIKTCSESRLLLL